MNSRIRNPYYAGPVSDHFDGTYFFNPGGEAPLGFRELMRWQFGGGRSVWPKIAPSPFPPAKPEDRIDGSALRVTMVGHASLLIQVAGLNILTDPVWSPRTSPFSFAGPKRVVGPGIRFEDLPPIDLIIVTHNPYDHLDLATLKRLHTERRSPIITPLGNETIIRRAVPEARISVMDWGQQLSIRDDVVIDCEPCHHWSARTARDRRMALWAAFVISTPSGKIYHIGDTGFHDGINYKAAAEKHGGFRLANLPIGAYEPRWFMKAQHQNPQEAVEGMLLCRTTYAAGHHFGTVQLTNEEIEAPVQALAVALEKQDVAPERFRALRAGEVFNIPEA
jgi:L-ascorbate metabolism protein UlaG (beta-lactamase superfamily)